MLFSPFLVFSYMQYDIFSIIVCLALELLVLPPATWDTMVAFGLNGELASMPFDVATPRLGSNKSSLIKALKHFTHYFRKAKISSNCYISINLYIF